MIGPAAARKAYHNYEMTDSDCVNMSNNPANALTKSEPSRALYCLLQISVVSHAVEQWIIGRGNSVFCSQKIIATENKERVALVKFCLKRHRLARHND